jgi:rhomboid protease GluP
LADEPGGFGDKIVAIVASVADALGFNGTRLRWRWNQRRRDLGEAGMRAEMAFRSARSAYKMCPSCRALVPRSARTCTECGSSLSSRRAPGLTRLVSNLIPGATATTFLILTANVGIFAVMLLHPAVTGGEEPASPISRLLRFDQYTLVRYGSGLSVLTRQLGEWWRLVTPVFLHGGLLHIAMNSWALVALGPLVEEEFGTERLAAIYVACGVAGSACSQFLRDTHTVGASGALCGLLGLLLVHGYRIGGAYGQRLRSVMTQNVVLMLFMSFLPGIDFLNHLGGFLAGCALGFVAPSGPFRNRATETLWVVLAWGSIVLVLASFWMMATRGADDLEMILRATGGG